MIVYFLVTTAAHRWITERYPASNPLVIVANLKSGHPRSMKAGGRIAREIALVGLSKTYRSAIRMVMHLRPAHAKRGPVSRETLLRADRCHVVVTTRDGRVFIGKLCLIGGGVELWQLVHGIPCRQRFSCEDILSCYVYSDEEVWDEPTQPVPRSGHPEWRDGEDSAARTLGLDSASTLA